MGARRFFACSSVSSTTAPPPSPSTKPLRSSLKGRLSPVGERARVRLRLRMAWGQMAASPAMTTAASAMPEMSSRAAAVTASPPEEQAVPTVRLGPWMPLWMANWAAARLPMYLIMSLGSPPLPPSS